MDIQQVKKKIEALVTRYEADKITYQGRGYSEAQVRMDFIDPFFECLGWDIKNQQGRDHPRFCVTAI